MRRVKSTPSKPMGIPRLPTSPLLRHIRSHRKRRRIVFVRFQSSYKVDNRNGGATKVALHLMPLKILAADDHRRPVFF